MRKRANSVAQARRPRRGVTLFEAVAAMALVGMISASALAAVGQGLSTAERARRYLEAEALSTQRLDALDLLTDQELQQLPDTVASGRFDQWDPNLREYTWNTVATPYTDQAGVYAVTITVYWPDGQYAVSTYLYRRPTTTTTGGRGG